MENRGLTNQKDASFRLARHVGLTSLVILGGFFGQESRPLQVSSFPYNPTGTAYSEPTEQLSPQTIAYRIMSLQEEVKPPDVPQVPDAVINAMKQYPTIFEKEDFEDLRMYYPIYTAVANKYNIDPKILWIFHSEETSCSRDPLTDIKRTVRDLDKNGNTLLENTIEGAMQMDAKFYGPDYVVEAFKGLEYLKNIKTRSPHDAEWIAAAARKISEDTKKSKGSLAEAFERYAEYSVAKRRLEKYNWYSQKLPSFQS